MAIVLHLAMTAAEFRENGRLSSPMAWMACHFSPYGTGLSNLPAQLPEGSLLIVNDRTPVFGHSPQRIAQQLEEAIAQLHCSGILLDFQREEDPQTHAIAEAVAALPCPVAMTPPYARGRKCAVFLPPVPLTTPLGNYIAPWQDQEIWLEAATDAACARIDKDGNQWLPPIARDIPYPHVDQNLHCRYRIDVQQTHVDFHLCRDEALLLELMEEGEKLGIQQFVGLYQQLGESFCQSMAQDTARFQS